MTVEVARVSSRAEADIIAGMLYANGIAATVQSDDVAGLNLAMQMLGVRVLVDAADAGVARQLLESPPNGEPEPGDDAS